MATTHDQVSSSSFSVPQFGQDLESTAAAIEAPFSSPCVHSVLSTFEQHFAHGVVVLRATSRPHDALNYRFYHHIEPSPSQEGNKDEDKEDILSIAIRASLLRASHPLLPLLRSWSALYSALHSASPSQWADFSASEPGLIKTWLNLNPPVPISALLPNADTNNDSILPPSFHAESLLQSFHARNLTRARFVCADFPHSTVNFYFTVPGRLDSELAEELTSLLDSSSSAPTSSSSYDYVPREGEVKEMNRFLDPRGFLFGVTVGVPGGEVSRVAIYAMDLDLASDMDLPSDVDIDSGFDVDMDVEGLSTPSSESASTSSSASTFSSASASEASSTSASELGSDLLVKDQHEARGRLGSFVEKVSDGKRTGGFGWSFGRDASRYLKAEAEYKGDFREMIRGKSKGSLFSSN